MLPGSCDHYSAIEMMWNQVEVWVTLLAVADVVMAGSVTIHAVLRKRDSRAVIGWVGLAWLAPFVGTIAYLVLGINRIERKALSLKLHESWDADQPTDAGVSDRRAVETLTRDDPSLSGLARAGANLTGLPVVPGNTIEPLIDGDQAYPEMLAAIRQAKTSVALLSYIFDNDRAGEAFLEALLDAQQRQVQVRVLIDDVGAKYSRPNMIRRLREHGLKVAGFLPTAIPFPIYANLRNHRKILIVDGSVGFTGGTNIREGHWLELEPKHPVQCLHFRLQGPVVSQMQKVFAMDWAFATDEVLTGKDWLSPSAAHGRVWARSIEHGPDEHFEKMADLIAAALAKAQRRVRIVTPYFLPNASLIQALNVTALRGVHVEIYLPAANNVALVQWAATAQMWQLLEKGCRIYYTTPPFDHTKLMIVDGSWTLIGSTNWDPRSLRLNFEFNVECYDEQLVQLLDTIVDQKAADAREVTLDEINRRSFPVQLRDGLARLLSPYL
ncbi:MAG: phospholipase D-like domain-containing protein [Planctomycetota bacterium]